MGNMELRRRPVGRGGATTGWARSAAGALAVTAAAAAVLVAPLSPARSATAAETAGATAAACTPEAADERAAAETAARCGHAVEVLAARTEWVQVFAEPAGGRRLVATTAPQRVRRADGSWATVDTDLSRQADGSLKPAATLADVSFSGGGTGPLVTWREKGSTFTLSWPLGSLPEPRVDGPAAVYESVLPGVNLHVTATELGYRHSVEVLDAAAAANPAVRRLRYALGGDIRVEQDAAGSLRLADGSGRTVAVSGDAAMWDSRSAGTPAGEARLGGGVARAAATAFEQGPASRTVPLGVTVRGTELAVTPDVALLAGPETTYPVFIDPPFEKPLSKWAYANTLNSNWAVNGQAWVGRNPADGTLYRSFFDFPVSELKGKKILSATARFILDHSWSCVPTPVHAYRTSAITVASGARMSWTTRPLPAAWLDSWDGNANERGDACPVQPDADAEFTGNTLRDDLQATADGGGATYTVGLCACNDSGQYESNEDRWKKFHVSGANTTPTLEVTYDSVPATPSLLSTSGQSCGATIGTSSPVLKAYYGDADGASDTLTGYFEYQQTKPTLGVIVPKTGQTKPGDSYGDSGVIALGAGAEGRTYRWRVKTKDAAGFESAPLYSAWCEFTVNVAVPPVPGVSSPTYLADGVAHGGPGESGSFTFTAGAPDVVKYVYGWAGQVQPLTTVTVVAGTSYTVTLTPPRHGFNTLDVHSIDSAGKQSQTNHYRFLVGAPDAPKAHWPLDTIDVHNFSDQIGDADLTPTGAVNWAYDSRIIGEGTASFDNSSLSTTGPVLDTTKSFSVSAWARLDAFTGAAQVVVSQSGTQRTRFNLYYSQSGGGWRFFMYDEDGASTGGSTAGGPAPVLGRWTHLLGVYDAATKQVSLYVDGQLAGSATHTPVWNATGPLNVGRSLENGAGAYRFKGQITDVRVWQRVVGPDDLWGTDADAGQGTQATAGILRPTEVASWDFNGAAGTGCNSTFSATYWSQMLDLNGCTDPDTPGQHAGYTGDAHDDNDALWLNHTQPDGNGTAGDGYAYTSSPIVRTDQSFTVSAWAKMEATSSTYQVVVSQVGDQQARFNLYHSLTGGGWQFYLYAEDGPSTAGAGVTGPAPVLGKWTHLVGVYDAAAGTLKLYVDGVLAGTNLHFGTPWHAANGLQVGRTTVNGTSTARFRGAVDQVKLFAGALTEREVRALYDNS